MLKRKQSDKSDQQSSVKQFFSVHSNYMANYDEHLQNVHTYSYLIRKKRIIDMIDNDQGKVLDIGCGPAVLTLELLNKGFEVWGMDLSEEVIEEACKKIGKTELSSSAHFTVGNIESLDFADEYFDMVICAGVFSYLDDVTQAIKEIYRVLKPGGIAIITVPNRRDVYICIRSLLLTFLRPFITEQNTLFGRKITIRRFKYTRYRPGLLDKLVLKNKFEKIDFAHYHFILFPFDVIFPNLSLSLGEKMEERFFKSKIFGWLGKGYILKAKK